MRKKLYGERVRVIDLIPDKLLTESTIVGFCICNEVALLCYLNRNDREAVFQTCVIGKTRMFIRLKML